MRGLLTNLGVLLLSASLAWGQQVTLSGQFALTGQRTTASQVVYFSEGVESGDLTGFSGTSASVPTASTDFAHSGTWSLRAHYTIADPSSPPKDHNVYAYSTISGSPTHYFISGWVYHKTPEAGGSCHQVQRKIFWTAADSGTTNWTNGLTTDSTATPAPCGMVLRFFVNGSAACSVSSSNAAPQYDADAAFWDVWVHLVVEVQLNTPGVADGVVRVWVNGTQVTEDLDMDLRGTCSSGLGHVRWGVQVTESDGVSDVDENRYHDDMMVTNYYVG